MIQVIFLKVSIFSYMCLAPNGTVQNLNTIEASPFATLITWDPPELKFQNGPILNYTIITTFSDPDTSVIGLDSNFEWVNHTSNTEILLRELRPGVNFSYTITAINSVGSGPSTPLEIFSMATGIFSPD